MAKARTSLVTTARRSEINTISLDRISQLELENRELLSICAKLTSINQSLAENLVKKKSRKRRVRIPGTSVVLVPAEIRGAEADDYMKNLMAEWEANPLDE